MMNSNTAGVYLHTPFCLRKCRYCDFYSVSGALSQKDDYTTALCREIAAEGDCVRSLPVDSIYFGGGTPTLLGGENLIRILCAVRDRFPVCEDAEITFEMNPATADLETLRALRAAGFNRVSLGVQSACDEELKALGRVHTAKEAMEAADLCRRAGFDELSMDVMYALPGQTIDSFDRTLTQVLSCAPTHLSAYGLIIEPGTPFYAERDTLPLPGDDAEADLYALCCERMKSAGFLHYEISNYALPGHMCRHNLRYWHRLPYYGFGPSAHSLRGHLRYENAADLPAYLKDPLSQRRTEEILTPASEAREYVMLGLRLSEGISLAAYEKMAGKSLTAGREAFLSDCLRAGYITLDRDRLALTEKGFYLSNSLICGLLSEDDE